MLWKTRHFPPVATLGHVAVGRGLRGLRQALVRRNDADASDHARPQPHLRCGHLDGQLTLAGCGGRKRACTPSLDRGPDFERPATARQVGATVTEPRLTTRKANGLQLTISRTGGQGCPLQSVAPDRHQTAGVGHMQPFVKGATLRVQPAHAFRQPALRRPGRPGPHTAGTIDMQPKLPDEREVGQNGQVINAARINPTGGTDYGKRLQTKGAVRRSWPRWSLQPMHSATPTNGPFRPGPSEASAAADRVLAALSKTRAVAQLWGCSPDHLNPDPRIARFFAKTRLGAS